MTASLLCAAALVPATGGAREVVAQASPADHPYSDPVWSPLRESARISCVRTNCEGPYHGYEAIDLVGEFGDPIHASGAGVAHIGGVAPGCVDGTPTRGTWVWIDHGPAGQTRYHHLGSVTIEEGQYVTPRTQIGTMGSSGDTAPCSTAYLHMERRGSADTSEKLAIPDFLACSEGERVRLPDHLGFDTWDDVPAQRHRTPRTDDSCIPTDWTRTPTRPDPVSVRPGVGSLTVGLPPVTAGVDDVRVRIQLFSPSVDRYSQVIERAADPASTVVTFDGLLANRRYRALVSHHGEVGWSAWSPQVDATTGFVPVTPEYRDSFATATTISLKWFRGTNSDADYTVAIRRRGRSDWGPWEYTEVPSTELAHRFRDLLRGATHQVTVQAHNRFGRSDFLLARTITTPCDPVCDPIPDPSGLRRAVRLSLHVPTTPSGG